MREHVGEEYEGIIAGIAQFGLFVQIEVPFVEGLIKADTIGEDHYRYDERTMRLVGERSGRSFALGDPVRVAIASVSVQQHKIDLELLEHTPSVSAAPQRNFKRRTKEESRAPGRSTGRAAARIGCSASAGEPTQKKIVRNFSSGEPIPPSGVTLEVA